MKVKKKFLYEGIELRIVEREELISNRSADTSTATRVLAPNGGMIPLQIQGKGTLKSIAEQTIKALDGFKARGADVHEILTKEIL